jgi:hypothetical protein
MWEKFKALQERLAGLVESHERPAVKDATYEELFSPDFNRSAACREVVRRLKPLLYQMALAKTGASGEADELMIRITGEIVHRFPVGSGDMGLQRLAVIIRSVLGTEAFETASLPRLYYTQLPLYYLPAHDRECIKTALDQMANPTDQGPVIDEGGIRETLRRANRQLEDAMYRDFDKDRLSQITEGYLPWKRRKAA